MRYGLTIKAVVLAAVALGGVGCVAQSQYDKMNTLYIRANEQIEDLKAKLESANATIKALQDAGKAPDGDLVSQLQKAVADRNAMAAALKDAEAKLREAGNVGPVLEPELDQALKDLVASDPDLMTYDPMRGMVRFKSDMTFTLGSTEVSAQAQASLAKLAEILERPVAQHYEVDIVGHTDNVRIGRAGTRAKYPTNWHLSVGRSIAVKDVLEKTGVAPMRIEVAGYGEYRPVVANSGSKGAEGNRRVEIYLVPMKYNGPGMGAALEAPASEAPAEEAAPAPKAPAAKEPAGAPESFK